MTVLGLVSGRLILDLLRSGSVLVSDWFGSVSRLICHMFPVLGNFRSFLYRSEPIGARDRISRF